ncbi:hypothetical protein AXF42_Ash015574 [Apostasia shenzhenica]|uniref:Uncharacterized protein n=1 Tax=Apostasia shenzhenica TaxID=1088818 RepID=A0A2I0AKK1_9ASPA|nr:hypothetical protein AXF42_Ash015574 [Apostasia shenzhenica]
MKKLDMLFLMTIISSPNKIEIYLSTIIFLKNFRMSWPHRQPKARFILKVGVICLLWLTRSQSILEKLELRKNFRQ